MSAVSIHRKMAKLKNIDIFFRDTQTDGPAILCLHGRWGRGETWVDFMQHYGEKYRVIAPDQRGHGLSGKPVAKYTAEEMANDMIDLLDYLQLPSVILVGHSMGGSIAGHLAATHPQYVRALALLDKSANGPETPCAIPLEELVVADPLTQDWPQPFKSLSEAQAFIKSATESDLSYQYFMNSLTETVEGYQMMFSAQAMTASVAYYENWYHLLPHIQCPVVVMRSSSHEAVPDEDYQKMQALIPHCTARELSHPDHNVQLGDKEEFYRYFDEFLSML